MTSRLVSTASLTLLGAVVCLQVMKAADRTDGKESGTISIAELNCAIDSWPQVHKSYQEGLRATGCGFCVAYCRQGRGKRCECRCMARAGGELLQRGRGSMSPLFKTA